MAILWILAIFPIEIVFIFYNGIAFGLEFLGACLLPFISTGAIKWSIMRGDAQQQLVIPIIGALIIVFAMWLSTEVEIHIFGYTIRGFALVITAGLVGVTMPLAWAEKRH